MITLSNAFYSSEIGKNPITGGFPDCLVYVRDDDVPHPYLAKET